MAKKANSLVPDPGRKIEFTEDMVKELYHCKQDVQYFANNYCFVIHPSLGKVRADLYDFQKRMIDGVTKNRQTIILAPRQCGKALSLDTPILTPTGFKNLGSIKVNDIIYGQDGKETRVKFITETMYKHDVYDIEFDTGEIIKADAEHLWNVSNSDWMVGKKTLKTEDLIPIHKRLQSRYKPSSLYINTCNSVEFNIRDINIHPYVLGVWIGDGSRCDGRITCHIDDYTHYKLKFKECGYDISEFRPDKRRVTTGAFNVIGLVTQLKTYGLIKNKHIPVDYYLNTVESRLNLIRGLMDSDGYCRKGGSCCFYQSNEEIIDSVSDILISLGIKVHKTVKKTTHKPCYTLCFATTELDIFSLPRKLEVQKRCKGHPKNNRIYIRSITKCESIPVRCLQVDNDDHLFLCGRTLIPTHNTTAISLVILHYAMFTPYKCCAILANKDAKSMSILNDVKTAFEHLPDWMKLGCIEWNAHTIKFENGSKIFASATSKDAIAGEAVSFLYIDECALIPENLAQEFYKANYPTISKGEKLVITSTARGVGNLFHSLWKGAIDKTNTYVPIRVDYWEVPEYSSALWKENMIADIGLIGFNSEYGNHFIGSQTTIVAAHALKLMKSMKPIREISIHDGYYRVYEEFDSSKPYIASIDVSTGSGNDFSVTNIFRVDWRQPIEEDVLEYQRKSEDVPEIVIYKLTQAAIFRSNLCNIPNFVDYTFEILPQWGDPYLILENNGIGQSFADKMLSEYYWENAYYHPNVKSGASITVGINSNSSTKIKMVNALKKFAESGKLQINDSNTVNEFLTYIEKKSSSGNSRFQAEDGSYDDCIVSTGWACFLADTVYMQDVLTFV